MDRHDRCSFLRLEDGLLVVIATILIRTHPHCVGFLQSTCKRLFGKLFPQIVRNLCPEQVARITRGERLNFHDVRFLVTAEICSCIEKSLARVRFSDRDIIPKYFALGTKGQMAFVAVGESTGNRLVYTRPNGSINFVLETALVPRIAENVRDLSFGGELPEGEGRTNCVGNFIIACVLDTGIVSIVIYGQWLLQVHVIRYENTHPNMRPSRLDVDNIRNTDRMFFNVGFGSVAVVDTSGPVDGWQILRNLPLMGPDSDYTFSAYKLTVSRDGTYFRVMTNAVQRFMTYGNRWTDWRSYPFPISQLFPVRMGTTQTGEHRDWIIVCGGLYNNMDQIATVSVSNSHASFVFREGHEQHSGSRKYGWCDQGVLISMSDVITEPSFPVVVYRAFVTHSPTLGRNILRLEVYKNIRMDLSGIFLPPPASYEITEIKWPSIDNIWIRVRKNVLNDILFVPRSSIFARHGIDES